MRSTSKSIFRQGIRAFSYHGVIEKKIDPRLERNFHLLSDFRNHIKLLKRIRVLSLEELIDELANSRKPFKPAAIITFDDGFANNLLVGEVLLKAKLPWGIFISTGAVEEGTPIWTVELALLLLHGQATKIDVFNTWWNLKSRQSREQAFQAIRNPLKSLPSELRIQSMASIRAQFPKDETIRLVNKFSSFEMLTWEQVTRLSLAGAEIGSHGVYHEIHHVDQTINVRNSELVESKATIQKRIRKNCKYFAFPNGQYHTQSPIEVRAAEYELAFTTEQGTIFPDSNPYLLPRLEPSSSFQKFLKKFFLNTC